MVTPLALAADSAPESHFGKSGSSIGPYEAGLELEFPAPVSESDSGLLCSFAKEIASCIDHPGEVRPGVGSCSLALSYCQKCSRLTGLLTQVTGSTCCVPPVDQSVKSDVHVNESSSMLM